MTVQQKQEPLLHTPSVLRTQLKAAAACVLLVAVLLVPLAGALYAAWLYCAKLLIAAVVTAELGFAVYYCCVLVRDFNRQPELHEPDNYDAQSVIDSFLRHIERVEDIKKYLSEWFLDAPFDSIHLENVKELVAYAVFYKTLDQMKEAGLMPQLEALLDRLQAVQGLTLPPGYNPKLRFMSHLWAEVPHVYRPLLFYLVMEFIEVLCWAMLRINNYKRHTIKGCVYYTLGFPDQLCGHAEPQQQQQHSNMVEQQEQEMQVSSTGQHYSQLEQQQDTSRENKQHCTVGQQPGKKNGTRKQRRKSRRGVQQRQQLQLASNASQHQGNNAGQQQQQQQQQCGGACIPVQNSGGAQAGGAAGEDTSGMPLVFLHGVGAGLLPYAGVIFTLATTGRPMVLPVWKHVSMRLTRTIHTVDEAADITLAVLERHGVTQAAFVGHSYGTCIAARIVRVAPHTVHTLALLDPVCLAMFMPNLVRYFLYTTQLSGDLLADFFIALLSSELHCARNFCRNFFWTDYNLFDEHLPERTLVALSGRDVLCPTTFVRQWLEGHTKAKVLFNPDAAHGAGLLKSPAWQCTILQHLMQLLQSTTSSDAVAAQPPAAAEGAESVAVPAAAAAGVEVIPGSAAVAAEAGAAADATMLVDDSSSVGSEAGWQGSTVAAASPPAAAHTAAAAAAAGVKHRHAASEDDDDDNDDADSFDASFMALPINGLDEAVDLDALIDAASDMVACLVEVLRSSKNSLRQQGKDVWDGLVQGVALPGLPGLPNLPNLTNLPNLSNLPNLPGLPVQLQPLQWQQSCSADAAREAGGYDQAPFGQWLKSAWVGG